MTNEPVYPVQEALAADVIGAPGYDEVRTKFSDT
jgi:hypothetical protein